MAATHTLTLARDKVTLAVQDLPGVTVASGSDGLKRLDYAIMAAGNEFVRRTGCTTTSDTATATADDYDLDVSGLTGFDPAHLREVTATDPDDAELIYPVDVVNLRDAMQDQLGNHGALQHPYVELTSFSLTPQQIAFKDTENAVLYPTPDKEWVYTFYYRPPFTSWTAGVADGDGVTLNIPDDMIDGVLWYGVPAFFENPNPANQYQESSRARFERHIRACRGRVALSAAIYANQRDYR
jgi:hypothetical protein